MHSLCEHLINVSFVRLRRNTWSEGIKWKITKNCFPWAYFHVSTHFDLLILHVPQVVQISIWKETSQMHLESGWSVNCHQTFFVLSCFSKGITKKCMNRLLIGPLSKETKVAKVCKCRLRFWKCINWYYCYHWFKAKVLYWVAKDSFPFERFYGNFDKIYCFLDLKCNRWGNFHKNWYYNLYLYSDNMCY